MKVEAVGGVDISFMAQRTTRDIVRFVAYLTVSLYIETVPLKIPVSFTVSEQTQIPRPLIGLVQYNSIIRSCVVKRIVFHMPKEA